MKKFFQLKDEFSMKDQASGNLSYSFEEESKICTDIEIILLKNGEKEEIIQIGKNVITYVGRSNMAHLLAGDDVTNRRIHQLKVGSGGHDPLNPTQPLLTSPSDIDLYGTLVITKNVSYSFPNGPSGNKVQFEAIVSENEGNGSGAQAISEVGLYDVEGRMMSHKTFGLITKSSAFGISFRYSFLF